MKIVHIVAGLESGGGIAEMVPQLCRHLQRRGHEVTLVSLAGEVSNAAQEAVADGVRVVQYQRSWPYFLFFSWQMAWRLRSECAKADVVHIHSNWTFPVWWGGRCAFKEKRKLVMTPHGCFDPVRLRYKWWKKRLVGGIDRWLLRRADVVHVTSEMEGEWMAGRLCRPAGVNAGRNTLVVVPNGVYCDHQVVAMERLKGEGQRVRRVVYLGRKHPLKGLDVLEAAWSALRGGADQCSEAGVQCSDGCHCTQGTGCNEEGKGRSGCVQDAQGREWELRLYGPGLPDGVVEGDEKWRVLQEADLVVLPTRSENFGIVVAEALAAGVPVITTKGAPWAELLGNPDQCSEASVQCSETSVQCSEKKQCSETSVQCSETSVQCSDGERREVTSEYCKLNTECSQSAGRCGWWIEVGVEPLVGALREAMGLSDAERRLMGDNGRRLVERKYTWEAVAVRMEEVYEGSNR